MVKRVPVSFKNRRGLLLRGVVHVPKEFDTAVVYLHGFPSTMEGSAKRFCSVLASRGYLCLRFDFSGSGASEGKFEHKLMSEEVKDTKAAIDFLAKKYPFKKLVLIGHSTGAIDAALYAYTDKRVKGLVLSGGVGYLDRAARYDFSDRQMHDFWKKGYIAYNRPGSWVHRKKLNKGFYEEFFTLDIPKAIKKYRRPLLILHGEKDEAIPATKDPKELYALASKPKKLVIIPKADHSFKKPGTQKLAVAAILKFIHSL